MDTASDSARSLGNGCVLPELLIYEWTKVKLRIENRKKNECNRDQPDVNYIHATDSVKLMS